jgi:hypothetical protein
MQLLVGSRVRPWTQVYRQVSYHKSKCLSNDLLRLGKSCDILAVARKREEVQYAFRNTPSKEARG